MGTRAVLGVHFAITLVQEWFQYLTLYQLQIKENLPLVNVEMEGTTYIFMIPMNSLLDAIMLAVSCDTFHFSPALLKRRE